MTRAAWIVLVGLFVVGCGDSDLDQFETEEPTETDTTTTDAAPSEDANANDAEASIVRECEPGEKTICNWPVLDAGNRHCDDEGRWGECDTYIDWMPPWPEIPSW